MGFLVTLAGGGHVHAFESPEDLLPKLATIFQVYESDVLFLASNCYSICGENIIQPEEIKYKQLTFLQTRDETIVISMLKSGLLIGVTICDGGFGWSIVREVWRNSDAEKIGIRVGDAIQSINGEELYGVGHFQVAQKLRVVSVGGAVAMTLLRPKSSGFAELIISIASHSKTPEDLKTTLQTSPEIPPFEFSNDIYTKLWLAMNK